MDVCCSAPFAERNHADIFPRKIKETRLLRRRIFGYPESEILT